jgi:hypothetical protein
LEARLGVLGSGRLLLAVEEHGGGCQLVRVRLSPRLAPAGALLGAALAGLSIGALAAGAWPAGVLLAGAAAGLGLRAAFDSAAGIAALARAVDAHAEAAGLARIARPARLPR